MAKYKKDIILTALILLSFLAFWLIRSNGSKADPKSVNIYVDGVLLRAVDLSVDDEFRIESKHGYNDITVKDGKIAVTGSDCDGKDCVKTGYISGNNGYIACLPHGLLISPKGDDSDSKGGVDAFAY
ncbi:MAG: NusG domain II-containing protein [Lachnospiraceae bacterium]|nr:NusG domain II-containing protein [Lachnospiraceae bacterium]